MAKRKAKKHRRPPKSHSSSTSGPPTFRDFMKQHNLQPNPMLQIEANSVALLLEIQYLLDKGFSSSSALDSEITIGLLHNFLSRVYEILSASLVSLSAGLGEASEALSRVALEGAVTVRYILAGDRNVRFLRFLYAYIEQDERQIRLWNESASQDGTADATHHLAAISKRKAASKLWTTLFENMFEGAGFTKEEVLREPWPSILVV